MTGLYLIAHKVRGLPAFDVAEQLQCPCCVEPDTSNSGCNECDHLGYWWVIPTSGHRAYPYWNTAMDNCIDLDVLDRMPPDLPDHYRTRAEPKFDLVAALGIKAKPQPSAPIPRRF